MRRYNTRRESVMARVQKTETCWLWIGRIMPDGYGAITFDNPPNRSKRFAAHRLVYEFLVGPIPEGLTLDHLCRVRHCVNPAHLEPVTMRVNVLRGVSPIAANAAATSCKHGHPFDEANTGYYTHRGLLHRRCKTCARIRATAARKIDPVRFRAARKRHYDKKTPFSKRGQQ